MSYRIIKTCIILVAIQFSAITTDAQQFTIDDVPLSWKDFKVRKDLNSHPYAAKIYPDFTLETKQSKKNGVTYQRFSWKIEFKGSWVKARFMDEAHDSTKQSLLNHEKGHLLIDMIGLKKVQKSIGNFTFSKRKKIELDSIYIVHLGNLRVDNERYDEETNHSRIAEKQKEWIDKLLTELNALYADEKKLRLELEAEARVN